MEPLYFVMAILGCGESDAPCRELRLVETRYQSEAACLAATEDALMRNDDILYPNVVASCRPAGAGPQLIRGTDVLMPEPEAVNFNRPRLASHQMQGRSLRR